jgi:hypothetical protein
MGQNELARQLGARLGREVSQSTVSDWLRKGVVPSGEYLLILPEILRVHPMWLFYGEGPMIGPSPAPGPMAERTQKAIEMGARSVLAELKHLVQRIEGELRREGEDVASAPRDGARAALDLVRLRDEAAHASRARRSRKSQG